ncbi:MAG: hypothetical protein PHX62_06600 [Bacilli bacterium]|nr:hypothetical protein [Bacilli bacterium]
MNYFELIKKHSAGLEFLYDFSEFRGRFNFLKAVRLLLRIILLIPCFLFFITVLVNIFILELIGFFASIPGNALAKLRANAGYDPKEYKWLFILTYLILYLVFLIFDVIAILLPVILAVYAFLLDGILWIAHLGRSEFVNLNLIIDNEGNEKTKFVWAYSSRSFSEVFINLVIVFFIYIISIRFYFRGGWELVRLLYIVFLALLQLGNYFYYKKYKYPKEET